MMIEVDDAVRLYVAEGIRRLARQLARDGAPVPDGLLGVADELQHGPERDVSRRRALAAARSRRYRARKRAERQQAARAA